MNEFIKAVSKFISRDVSFVIGGGSIIGSFIFLFDPKLLKDLQPLPIWFLLFLAAVAYVVGFVTQEGFSLMSIVTTAAISPGKNYLKHLFEVWDRSKWEVPDYFNDLKWYLSVLDSGDKNQRLIDCIERIINLQIMGAAVGSSWFVSTVLLTVKSCLEPEPVNIAMTFFTLMFSVVLIECSWLQGMMRRKALFEESCKTLQRKCELDGAEQPAQPDN